MQHMPKRKRSPEQIKQVVYLPKPLHKRLRSEAFRQDPSRSALMTEALAKYFDGDKCNGEKANAE